MLSGSVLARCGPGAERRCGGRRLYEEKKQVIVHDYMIRSDFVVESKNRTIMGYCRQDRLPVISAIFLRPG